MGDGPVPRNSSAVRLQAVGVLPSCHLPPGCRPVAFQAKLMLALMIAMPATTRASIALSSSGRQISCGGVAQTRTRGARATRPRRWDGAVQILYRRVANVHGWQE